MSKIVERTLDFLEIFAEQRRPLSLSDISRLLDIPVSSCHDVMQSLIARGYLYEVAPRAGHYPTLRLSEVARIIAENDPVLLRADRPLRALRDELDETVLLAKVSGLHATYLLVCEPHHPLRYQRKVGELAGRLHSTSLGKALLAALPPAELDAAMQTLTFERFTARTITTMDDLRLDIDIGRQRGWFGNIEESLDDVTTLSAPLQLMNSLFIVSIAGPSGRIGPRLETAAEALLAVCRTIEGQNDATGPAIAPLHVAHRLATDKRSKR